MHHIQRLHDRRAVIANGHIALTCGRNAANWGREGHAGQLAAGGPVSHRCCGSNPSSCASQPATCLLPIASICTYPVIVHELVHATRAQRGADDVGDGRAGVDVGHQLRRSLASVRALLEQNDLWLLRECAKVFSCARAGDQGHAALSTHRHVPSPPPTQIKRTMPNGNMTAGSVSFKWKRRSKLSLFD